MAKVRFSRGVSSIVADATCTRQWRIPGTGQPGQATITLPKSSAAASSTYINPNGGSLVRILDDAGCGDWTGIVMPLTWAQDGSFTITAMQLWGLLGRRIVDRAQTLTNVSPGMIATLILRGSLEGVRGLHAGTLPYEGGGTHVPTFTFSRQDAWSAFSTLMEAHDGEVHVTATGEVQWIGNLASAPLFPTLLIADGNLTDWRYTSDGSQRAASVTAAAGTTSYTAKRGDVATDGWPAQMSITATDTLGVAATATAELERRSLPAVSLEGRVGQALWGIRERQFVRVIVPAARFTGATHTCRLLGRTLSDDSEGMSLELQAIAPLAPAARGVGAGARAVPPQRPPADLKSGGRKGSLGQLLRRLAQR